MPALKAGVYRLKKNVLNPVCDRRQKRSWEKLVLWPIGMLFHVTTTDAHWYGGAAGQMISQLTSLDGGHYYVEGGSSGEHIWTLLVPELELVPPEKYTTGIAVRVNERGAGHVRPEDVLALMVDVGTITPQDIIAAARDSDDMDDDDWTEFCERHQLR